jgi:2-polyprenyl-6-hydroxyphenyl methylase/3-demethylubiquinone-9 3-methyltransferase
VIAGYVRKLAKSARLLDLGCGQAVLYDYLHPTSLARYVGVDVAPAALQTANVDPAKATLIAGRIERLPVDGVFDIIVWNEILYCLADPIGNLRRYAGLLADPGYMIVSMHTHNHHPPEDARRIAALWREIEAAGFGTVDGTAIVNASTGLEWVVRVFTPPSEETRLATGN